MNFSAIFQLRTKKFWWMDVIFYFVISLLVATVFCYIIFLVKNYLQREEIKKEIVALETVGTEQQKEYEKEVINYRNKINDFSGLLQNHEFASNVFAFMQTQTMPNVWFLQFNLDEKNRTIQLSGEADTMDAFSRQIAVFEKNQYVKSLGAISSSLGGGARIQFRFNLTLDQTVFSYIYNAALTAALEEQPAEIEQENLQSATEATALSSEKLITSFHLLLDPEVIGTIDQTNFIVKLDVPYDTDVKNLTPSLFISPLATVFPPSDVAQDFTDPVVYTVTAQDNSTQEYKAVVNVLPKTAKNFGSQRASIIIGLIVLIVVAVAVIVFFYWKKLKAKKASL